MTRTSSQVGYARGATVVWRDTGAQIVALPLGVRSEVVVLGGGSAQIWRLLNRRRTVAEIMDALESRGSDVHSEEVVAAIQNLVEHGLVAARDAG